MEPSNLRVRAEECVLDFDVLVDVQPFTCGNNHCNATNIDAEEQKTRFLIWSANIGVFANGHASLDYRLRDSPDARKITSDLLASLGDHLRRAIASVRVNGEDRSSTNLTAGSETSFRNDEFSGASSSSFSSSYQASASHDSLSNSVDQDRTPFKQLLHGAEKTIDRLYRLSVAIRQPSILSQNVKAANFVIKDENGNDVSAEFGDYALTLITHEFPDATPEIRERLANCIALRRKRFLYRQSHQKRLGTKPYLTPLPIAKPHLSGLEAESTVVARTVNEKSAQSLNDDNQSRVFRPGLPSQASASKVSGMIKFQTEEIYEGTPSKAPSVYPGFVTQEVSISIPTPPKPSPGSKEFECSYCCMMLPIKESAPSHWKSHVLNDLEPYVCVFGGCKEAYRLFRDQVSWLSHMRETHTKQWTCTAAGHKLCIFETEKDFELHMGTDHAKDFKESQLSWYKKHSQSASEVIFTSCPLCKYTPTEEDILNVATAKGVDHNDKHERGKVISEDIVRCVASHLQALSLKALAWPDAAASDRPLYHCGTYQEEWGFVPRPDYYGHDRDPFLQKLLRNLYLNSSSAVDRRTDTILPVYMMPPAPLNENFFGRDYALDAIKSQLCQKIMSKPADTIAVTYPLTFALCAPGGMGKTQIAVKFALTHMEDFDAIFWVNADSPNEIAQSFRRIARLLDLIPEGSSDANDLRFIRESVKRWLVSPRGRDKNGDRKPGKMVTWLLIYDGVQNPDDLNDYWPYDGPGSILVTSRNPFSWAKSLPLKPFDSAESIAFLLKLTGRELFSFEKNSLTRISARLGGLPLALTQMGSIIMRKKLTFCQFLDAYNERESQRELLQFQTGLKSQSYEHTIASVWAFENLKHGRILLNVLSMIDPDGIPEKLLVSAMVNINLPGYPTTIEEYRHARGELLACSLVTCNKQEHKLFIHRLVQDVARARMGQAEFHQTFVTCVRLVASVWPFENFAWRHGIARWPACEELFPHIARLKDLFPALPPSSDNPNAYHFSRLLTDAGWYLHERGRQLDSNLFNNMAQAICESLKYRLYEHNYEVSNHEITHAELDCTLAELYHNRGCIASEANDATGAMKNLKIFHDMMERELGKEIQRTDMRLGLACNELGNAYMLKDDWAQGEKLFLRSIKLLRQLDNFEPVLISLPLINLGYSFWLQGRLNEAATILNEGARDREAKYGEHDLTSFISGRFYHALGNVCYDQGSTVESLNYHRKALHHYKFTLGNNHHRTASAFVKVAEHKIRDHQYDTAIALLDHALMTYSLSNNYIPDKTRASFKRCRALRALANTHEADKELRKCFQVYTELVTEKSKLTGQQLVPKNRAEDLVDSDFDSLVAFWSK